MVGKGWTSADDRPNASLIPRTYLEINLNLGCPARFLYGEGKKDFVRAATWISPSSSFSIVVVVVVLYLFSSGAALE